MNTLAGRGPGTQPALWSPCSICLRPRVDHRDDDLEQTRDADEHAKCDAAFMRWLLRHDMPEVPPNVQGEFIPYWHVTSAARLRRRARRRWTRPTVNAAALRVVS